MKKHSDLLFHQMIRLGTLLSLIFFACVVWYGCKQKEDITIVWEENRARALAIPKEVSGNNAGVLQVRLKNRSEAVLGNFEEEQDAIIFRPVVAFTAGSEYQIFSGDKMIGAIQIPIPASAKRTGLTAIYPSADTLPENLLKVYFQFSAPMREGEALQYIHLLGNNGDTVPGVFLDLQPELWNKERTALTLWLDPGRIKRDLMPNRKMGNPLQKGAWYTMVVSEQWKDVQGIYLEKKREKKFFVGERDSISPQLQSWIISPPAAGTQMALQINLGEPLDYFLLGETIEIVNEKNETISGEIKIGQQERIVSFIPDQPWQKGHYRIRVASHLEDLAGNNLNKPFDRDLGTQKMVSDKDVFERTFFIEK